MHRPLLIVVTICTLAGCRASVDVPASPPPPVETHVTLSETRSEANVIRDFGIDLNEDHDALREAEILRRLHAYLAEHNLLFKVHSSRELPTTSATHVEVFRGEQPLESFTFIPRDSRNLALLGQ